MILGGIILGGCQRQSLERPKVANGQVDLSSWDFEKDGLTNLNGEWNFYWGKKIQNSNQLKSTNAPKGTCNMPGSWTEEVSENTYFEQNGVATYHVQLTLPDTFQTYALKLNVIYSSYELWANGQLLTNVGELGETESTTTPNFYTKLVTLPRQKNVNLFLSIACWQHRRGGGTPDPIIIGTQSQVYELWLENHNHQLFYFAFIIGLSIYLIALYLFYPENKSYLYFGLFAFFCSIRAICIDEMVIESLLNDIPYYWNQRLRYVGYFACIGCIILYVESLFKKYAHALFKVGAYLLFGYSASLFIIPFRWSSYLSPVFQLVTVLWIIGLFHLYFKAKAYKQIEYMVLIFGGLVAALTAIHQMLVTNNIIESEYYHNIAATIYIFTQILSMAYTHRKVYYKANQLSQELLTLNKDLEDKVELRTIEIREKSEELKGANEQLQELDKTKTRFFANISHELRTPLTLIMGLIDRSKSIVKNKKIQDDLSKAKRHSYLLQQLINQLLDITKLEAGKMKLAPQKQPVIQLLKNYLLNFESLALEKNIRLHFDSNVQHADMYIDEQAFSKIIYNLLSNAMKFTPQDGHICLEVNAQREGLSIVVKDTGVGIAADQLPYIFDRFYQVDKSLSKEYEGTGIGLSLVKELVKLHGGEIEVSSIVGGGTVFTLKFHGEVFIGKNESQLEEFPKKLTNKANMEVSLSVTNSPQTNEDGAGKTDKPLILIVEDHPDLQDLIKDNLKQNYQIIQAYDGESGVKLAHDHVPDLIISDVMMPKKNGFELCQQLKREELTSHIPIILLTARAEQTDKLHGLEIGADDYLAKPFDHQELSIRIHNLIQSRRLLRERFEGKSEMLVFQPSEVAHNATDLAFMDKLLNLLEQNYKDELFTPDQISGFFNMSKRQLNRKLKSIMNSTSTKLLQNFRLQKAKELLNDRALRIGEISFMVGFSSQSYFNRMFKNKFGLTPKEYQENLGKTL